MSFDIPSLGLKDIPLPSMPEIPDIEMPYIELPNAELLNRVWDPVDTIHIFGYVLLFFVFMSLLFLLIMLGACNPIPLPVNWFKVHGEPYPRAWIAQQSPPCICVFVSVLVRWSYPEGTKHRHWFLVHVSETRLDKEMFVVSISQYVGARGTSGAKLMLVGCACVATSQLFIALLIWQQSSQNGDDTTRLILSACGGLALIVLGMAESALDWKSAENRERGGELETVLDEQKHPLVRVKSVAKQEQERREARLSTPRFHATNSNSSDKKENYNARNDSQDTDTDDTDITKNGALDHQNHNETTLRQRKKVAVNPSASDTGTATVSPRRHQTDSPTANHHSDKEQRDNTQVDTEEEDVQDKACIRNLHMFAAFAVVAFQVANQAVGAWHQDGRILPFAVSLVGFVAFIVFCLMQWLSGANDEMITGPFIPYRAENVIDGPCRCFKSCCYCPPGFQYDKSIKACCICDCGPNGKRNKLVCASWWFIGVELVAFSALMSTAGLEAITIPHRY